jgi:3-phosphoshikimate 1-carboxyvinyltransferase
VDLTVDVMRRFGASAERLGSLHWRVSPQEYRGSEMRIEGDHSSSSYFLAAAAVVGGCVRVENLDPESRQPDARLGSFLEEIGCVVRRGRDWIEVAGAGRIPGFEADLSEAPDLAPTLAVIALFADGPCSIRGVPHLRLKESDRLAVLAENLTRLGRPARAGEDALEVGAPVQAPLRRATIATASDHRIAMAFAVAGLRTGGIAVDDARCVAKSNPGFWEDLERLRAGRP